jgi:hypothetical protein
MELPRLGRLGGRFGISATLNGLISSDVRVDMKAEVLFGARARRVWRESLVVSPIFMSNTLLELEEVDLELVFLTRRTGLGSTAPTTSPRGCSETLDGLVELLKPFGPEFQGSAGVLVVCLRWGGTSPITVKSRDTFVPSLKTRNA